jgi:hypothetical protein
LEGLFRVEEPLKGNLGQTVRITYRAPNMFCSPSFRVGQSVVVAAYGDAERGYETDDCTQFEASYDAEPDDAEADPVLAAAARQRAWLATLAAAAESDPGNPVPLITQARFLGATNGTIEAITTLDRVLAADPLQRDAILLKAELLSARKHDDQALALAETYLAAHPDDAEARRRQALSLIRLGRIGEVAQDWRDFSTLEAENLDFSKRDLAGASFRGGDLATPASPAPISGTRTCPASKCGWMVTSRPPISPGRTCGRLASMHPSPPRTSAAPTCAAPIWAVTLPARSLRVRRRPTLPSPTAGSDRPRSCHWCAPRRRDWSPTKAPSTM